MVYQSTTKAVEGSNGKMEGSFEKQMKTIQVLHENNNVKKHDSFCMRKIERLHGIYSLTYT